MKLDLGPLTVVIDGTCSGARPTIVEECIDPSTGEKWLREIGKTDTCYVETDAARASDEMPGTFQEAPHRFGPKDGGEESIAIANLFAAAPDLRAALEKIAGFTMSQFMGPHDMALECVNTAVEALAKLDQEAA